MKDSHCCPRNQTELCWI